MRPKILAIKQPWASLIVHGLKDVENRTWRTDYRGTLIVHASKRGDDVTAAEIARRYGVRPPSLLPEGGIIGIVEIVDCVRGHKSKWYQRGQWALVLAKARPVPFVPWRGVQSLQAAPPALLELLNIKGDHQ
jgi:hypothetical protein